MDQTHKMKHTLIAITIYLGLSVQGAFAFELASNDLTKDGRITNQHVANAFGCTGDNLSPHLVWKNPPKGTKSYAITVYDPDAPTGSGWWHWLVWNIPVTVSSLPTGVGHEILLAQGASEGQTDIGTAGYFGVCPPKGDKSHRYQFKVFALKVERLELPENPMPALVGFMLKANSLGSANLTARLSR
jgi:Raf kinase inhibitor-like YbhB/YbcL family protein